MGEVFSAFGLDGKLIVIQIINFGLLLLALWYFLYTPILNLINERQRTVAKGVEDAKRAEAKLERAEGEKQEIIKQAHSEAGTIVSRSKEHAEKQGADIRAEAEQKHDRILAEAKQKAEALKRDAQKESEKEIARTAVLAAEKVLRERK